MGQETPLEHCPCVALKSLGLRLVLSEFPVNGSGPFLELAADVFNAGNPTPCYSLGLLPYNLVRG